METDYANNWINRRTDSQCVQAGKDCDRAMHDRLRQLLPWQWLAIGLAAIRNVMFNGSTWPMIAALIGGSVLIGVTWSLLRFSQQQRFQTTNATTDTDDFIHDSLSILLLLWAIGMLPLSGIDTNINGLLFVVLTVIAGYQNVRRLALVSALAIFYQLGASLLAMQTTTLPISFPLDTAVISLLPAAGLILFSFVLISIIGQQQHQLRIAFRRLAVSEKTTLEHEKLIWTRTKELKSANRHSENQTFNRELAETDRGNVTTTKLKRSFQSKILILDTGDTLASEQVNGHAVSK